MSGGPFMEAFNGRFRGVLRWEELDGLWARIEAAPEGWYIYAVHEAPPELAASADALRRFLAETRARLRRDHAYDYCGIVYADSLEAPGLVKIYDPGNLGAVCGSSGARVLPRWVLSRVAPACLAAPAPSRWLRWRGLLSFG